MKQMDKLQYIVKEIKDLAGAVAFGQSKLEEFYEMLALLDADISSIMHYRHYQACTQEHRRMRAMLMTTNQSLTGWRVLVMEYCQDLDELLTQSDVSMQPEMQESRMKCEKLLDEVLIHRQEIEKMETRMTNLAHRLVQKKRILSAQEIGLLN